MQVFAGDPDMLRAPMLPGSLSSHRGSVWEMHASESCNYCTGACQLACKVRCDHTGEDWNINRMCEKRPQRRHNLSNTTFMQTFMPGENGHQPEGWRCAEMHHNASTSFIGCEKFIIWASAHESSILLPRPDFCCRWPTYTKNLCWLASRVY